ncbi:MAG TPA: hypothetical protein PLW86_17860, partial [Rhodocyclaceae bacterium]|nr:hypothetical protein [Rhodocyclaceae bacterium]
MHFSKALIIGHLSYIDKSARNRIPMSTHARTQSWLVSARFDCLWIIGPAFWITAVVLWSAEAIHDLEETPLWLWAVLVMGVDVGHVYSTLFRTYFDEAEFAARRLLYLGVPAGLFLLGCFLYWLGGAGLFWRVLAYSAVFHFVRQQYGFFMLYNRHERDQAPWMKRLDVMLIYLATLYPLIYWHTHTRQITWFTEHDFIALPLPGLATMAAALYAGAAVVYLGKEIHRWRQTGYINLAKQLLLLGTALSWWVGIITFDHDLAFTAINTVAHGIPYLALIWIYGRNQQALGLHTWYWEGMGKIFSWRWLPAFAGLLLLLAYFEEGLWDSLVWRERAALFEP